MNFSTLATSVAFASCTFATPLGAKVTDAVLIRPVQYVHISVDEPDDLGISEMNLMQSAVSPVAHIVKLRERITAFENLVDNWDGYGAAELSNQAVNNALSLLRLINYESLVYLHEDDIIPSTYGTISLEWFNNRRDNVCIEIGDSEIAFFYDVEGIKGGSENNQAFTPNEIPSEARRAIDRLSRKGASNSPA